MLPNWIPPAPKLWPDPSHLPAIMHALLGNLALLSISLEYFEKFLVFSSLPAQVIKCKDGAM